ncbi:MAG: carbonic anhydrase [Verrucomicrobiales bacterium]
MSLFESIIQENHRASATGETVTCDLSAFEHSLPVVALTCIDPRLNELVPRALGIPAEKFIWLRNAGNIITGPVSSTMRSIALACAVKGGKEIAILGHTDCLVCKTNVMQLTDRFRELGVDRGRLPENFNEFFGLFASERQNVTKAVDFVRSSPLIGTHTPLHGLLLDLKTGKLDWVVNGYQTAATSYQTAAAPVEAAASNQSFPTLADFQIGTMPFPEGQIGEFLSTGRQEAGAIADAFSQAKEKLKDTLGDGQPELDRKVYFKVLGPDGTVYSPVSGATLQQWIQEGRIDWAAPAQSEESTDGSRWLILRTAPLPHPCPPQPTRLSCSSGSRARPAADW